MELNEIAVVSVLEFISMLEGPGESFIFIKVLSLVVMANQIQVLQEDEEVVKVARDLAEILLQLRWQVDGCISSMHSSVV